MGSRKTSGNGETRMLERRVSNNRADLTGDQRMNYFLSWFTTWSDLQKSDFVKILHRNMNGIENESNQVNGERGGGKKPPSLFECQVKLFNDWFSGWSDDQKNYLVLRLEAIDADFFAGYEAYDGPSASGAKDYFEPGVPPELVRKSSKTSLNPQTFKVSNATATVNDHEDEERKEKDEIIEEAFQKLSTSSTPHEKQLESIAE